MEENKEGAACGSKKCCGKALAAVGLLALGGLGGYFIGLRCGSMCAAKNAPAIMAPATK